MHPSAWVPPRVNHSPLAVVDVLVVSKRLPDPPCIGQQSFRKASAMQPLQGFMTQDDRFRKAVPNSCVSAIRHFLPGLKTYFLKEVRNPRHELVLRRHVRRKYLNEILGEPLYRGTMDSG